MRQKFGIIPKKVKAKGVLREEKKNPVEHHSSKHMQ